MTCVNILEFFKVDANVPWKQRPQRILCTPLRSNVCSPMMLHVQKLNRKIINRFVVYESIASRAVVVKAEPWPMVCGTCSNLTKHTMESHMSRGLVAPVVCILTTGCTGDSGGGSMAGCVALWSRGNGADEI